MPDGRPKDQDQDGPLEVEIVICPGGLVLIPKLPEMAELAMHLGDEEAYKNCLAARDVKVIVGSRKCG